MSTVDPSTMDDQRDRTGRHRPPFWRWFRLRETTLRDLAGDLAQAGSGVSHQTLFFYMLPWADPRRLTPSDALKAAIETLTGGEVRADRDWTGPAGGEPQAGEQ